MNNQLQLDLFGGENCLRWNNREHSWRHLSEGGFDQRRYRAVAIDETDAKSFVTTHHYSKSYPASRLRYGLVEAERLVGVIVLGVPMRKSVLTNVFPTLEAYEQSLELSRMVLLDEVPANAESYMLGQVFRQAAEEGVRGVLAFSDPVPRLIAGELLLRGHYGTSYAAHNATYTGRGTKRTLRILPDGTVLSDRSASKVRGRERGMWHVVERLVALGARPLDARENTRAWLDEALGTVGVMRVRHPGNHRFAWTIGDRGQRRRTPIALDALPYPKTADPIPDVMRRADLTRAA